MLHHEPLYAVSLEPQTLTSYASLTSDPKYEEEVSGCTACVGLIAGNKLYVVSLPRP